MEKLILDYSKWRCGGDNVSHQKNVLGEGTTSLLNQQGFSCCLGLIAPQLDSGITSDDILLKGLPEEVEKEIPFLSVKKYDFDDQEREYAYITNTSLTNSAVGINDDYYTTPEEKIELLSELFKTVDYELEVINKP